MVIQKCSERSLVVTVKNQLQVLAVTEENRLQLGLAKTKNRRLLRKYGAWVPLAEYAPEGCEGGQTRPNQGDSLF